MRHWITITRSDEARAAALDRNSAEQLLALARALAHTCSDAPPTDVILEVHTVLADEARAILKELDTAARRIAVHHIDLDAAARL